MLGTGVNPGLVMDRLVLEAAGACVSIDRVRVTRVVDAAKRRGPLRAKVGAGLTRQEFLAGVAARSSATSDCPNRRRSSPMASPADRRDHRNDRARIAKVATDGIEAGHVLGLHQIALVQAGDEIRSRST